MHYPNFIGGSAQSQSPLADVQRTVNWYVEQMEAPGAKARQVLYPTPGSRAFLSTADVGTRAMFSMAGRAHAVIGGNVREFFATQTSTVRGAVVQDNYPATLSYNGTTGDQLFVTSGTHGYSLDLNSNVLTQELTGTATMGGMIDGYFLAFDIRTGIVKVSALNDGTTWDPTQFFARSIAPDPWQAMVIDGNRKVWLIGEQTGEVWYDSGAYPQPFAPIQGAVFRSGTLAPFSVQAAGDQMIWLSRNSDGAGIIVGARGYSPQRISTHPVETAIAGYARTSRITDAEAFVYQDQGHLFYVLTFPAANATWVYDVTTGQWAERGTWNSALNRFDYYHPRVHCYAFGKHLTGERANGTIAEMDVTFGTEVDGAPIRRVRVAPGLTQEGARLRYTQLELYLETGVGLVDGDEPIVMLRTSDDGGHTWSAERQCGAGLRGQYKTRVFWTRLGQSSDRVFEVSVSDAVPWRMVDAYLEMAGMKAA